MRYKVVLRTNGQWVVIGKGGRAVHVTDTMEDADNYAAELNDKRNIGETAVAVVVGALVLAVWLFYHSPNVQRWRFLHDCTETYELEHCEDVWDQGNGR